MEVAAGLAASSSSSCFSHVTSARVGVSFRPRRNANNHRFVLDSSSSAAGAAVEFRDNGHLQYYYVKCGGGSNVMSNNKKSKEKLSVKKTSKLIKSLSKDLTLFSQSDHNGLVDHHQATLLQETAQGLMNQLQELRAKEKKLKMQKKQAKLASRNRVKMDSESSSESSSSSSESSDSDGEVINMRHLRNGAVPVAEPMLPEIVHQIAHQHLENPPSTSEWHLSNGAGPVADPMLPEIIHQLTHQHVENPPSTSESHLNSVCCGIGTGGSSSTKRIEVCMGGKCKKSGGAALLEEFQRVLGVEGVAAVGCKCMGKCRDGPNVRVASSDDATLAPNPLCIGVALEDIDVIVANFFGEDHKPLALAPVS